MVKRRKKARFNVWKTILFSIIFMFLLTTVASFGVVLAIIQSAPPLDVNQILTLNEASVLYNDKNEIMDKVITTEERKVIPFNDMPQDLKNAFVSIEDERFYKHSGIDLKRITGALFINVKNKIKRQSGIQGASTISQQLLKNTLLSSEVSFKRKIQEMYLAVNLEKSLSKNQILEAYMNTIYLGGRSYGVEAASQQYFNKPAKELSLLQSAFIAGVPQSPSVYYLSATAKKDTSLYINRTQSVLRKMLENGYISDAQYNSSMNDLSANKLVFESPKSVNTKLNYKWFSVPTIEQVKKDLKAKYRYTDTEVQHLIMYGGLKIHTTMNKSAQDNTEKALNEDPALTAMSYTDKNNVLQPQASAVIMDYHSGEVKALVGGRGEPGSYNRAASSNYLRPPGSSIKPLTVYGPAIDTKEFNASSVLLDGPIPTEIGKKYPTANGPYNPQNDNRSFSGDVTISNAITHSINVIAVKIEDKLGLKTGADYAEKFGINLDEADRSSIAALSLGQLTRGTNTLTMATAYGTFGNEGKLTPAKMYSKVVDRSGKVLLENKHKTNKVLSAESAYIMYDLLKGPVSSEGTAPRANFGNMPVRGKTGTSGDGRDLWFCGLTPYYSASVWIGNDDNSPIYGGINSNYSAGLWSTIMQPIHENSEPKELPIPTGLTSVAVCRQSGKLATSACYAFHTVSTEFFLEGTGPSDYCNHSFIPFIKNPIDSINEKNQQQTPEKKEDKNTNDTTNTNTNPNNGTDKPTDNNNQNNDQNSTNTNPQPVPPENHTDNSKNHNKHSKIR